MRIELTSDIAAVRERLTEFSDRRFAAACATALSRTAVYVRNGLTRQLPAVFSRPTPYTLNSIFAKPAKADNLTAHVDVKDDRAVTKGGTAPTDYLLPQVQGGARRMKRLEVALNAIGALPSGWRIVPGQGARLDAYGNVERGQVVQVLSQLRIQLVAGSSRNMSFDARKMISAQRRAGGRFFVLQPGKTKAAPGIYQRELFGRTITPVLIFVQRASYPKRWDFYGSARRMSADQLPVEFNRAISDSLARLRARGAGR